MISNKTSLREQSIILWPPRPQSIPPSPFYHSRPEILESYEPSLPPKPQFWAYDILGREREITWSLEEPVEPTARYNPKPVLEVSQEASRFLTNQVNPLLGCLITLIMARAQLSFIFITSFIFRVRLYPQEKYEELVVEVSVQASAKQALAFWDSLESTLETWEREVVPARLRERISSLISVSVIWG